MHTVSVQITEVFLAMRVLVNSCVKVTQDQAELVEAFAEIK